MLKFYHDAALTQEVTALNPINPSMDALGTIVPYVDKQVWLGSTTADMRYRALSNPGVDQIIVDVVDSGSGTGEPDTAIKLSLTSGGLAGAVAGASLNVGTQILSGVANAVSVWIRYDDQTGVVGNYTDVYPETNDLHEESTV
jgi:hypothetical protein